MRYFTYVFFDKTKLFLVQFNTLSLDKSYTVHTNSVTIIVHNKKNSLRNLRILLFFRQKLKIGKINEI